MRQTHDGETDPHELFTSGTFPFFLSLNTSSRKQEQHRIKPEFLLISSLFRWRRASAHLSGEVRCILKSSCGCRIKDFTFIFQFEPHKHTSGLNEGEERERGEQVGNDELCAHLSAAALKTDAFTARETLQNIISMWGATSCANVWCADSTRLQEVLDLHLRSDLHGLSLTSSTVAVQRQSIVLQSLPSTLTAWTMSLKLELKWVLWLNKGCREMGVSDRLWLLWKPASHSDQLWFQQAGNEFVTKTWL